MIDGNSYIQGTSEDYLVSFAKTAWTSWSDFSKQSSLYFNCIISM